MSEDEEFERVSASYDRFMAMPEDELDEDEFHRVMERWHELRKAGHGPQPYNEPDFPR